MNDTDKILESLDDKPTLRKPANWPLWASLFFAELIFVLLDAGSAIMVALITGMWYYGVIVFFAGVIPLWLYTKTYTRPLASKSQKSAALLGGTIAVGSVIVVAIFVAVLNFAANQLSGNAIAWMEAGLGISLVVLLAVHGFVNAYYFFTDEEWIENNKTERIIARGNRAINRITAAQGVANAKRREVSARTALEGQFSPQVVNKILSMMADDDGDGIPNFIDPVDNRVMAKTIQPVPELQEQSNNGAHPPKV